jgi:ATP-dependent Clp protease ATP-binding subunit ClpX
MAGKDFDLTSFNYRPDTLKRSLDQYIYGQEEVKRALSVGFWQHYSRLARKYSNPGDPLIPKNKPNILIIGGTGTGKTLAVSRICKLLSVPYQYVDSTDYSEAGYVGENVFEIPLQLYESAGRDVQRAELGVIHIDEIDKKAARYNDNDDVSRGGVQGSFLTLIEGKELLVDFDLKLNTQNMLFVASGAFEGIEKIIKKRVDYQIGFGSNPLSKSDLRRLRPSIDDLEKYGMNRQLLGRFPILTYTDSFNSEDLYNILKLKKNPLVPDLISDFQELGIQIQVAEEAYRYIGEIAAKTPLGARSLAQVVNNTFRESLYELGAREIKEIVIDKNFIENPKRELELILKGAKLKDSQELIVPVSLESKVTDKKSTESKNKLKFTKRTYSQKLHSYGLKSEFIAAATSCGVKNDLDPYDLFIVISEFNQEIDGLYQHFKTEFKKDIDITENCRYALINMGLHNFGESISALIYEPIWSKFEENSELIKKSRKKIVTLDSLDPEDLEHFFQQL